jgi:uncharacterized membrane protein SpoIIM required for sporulation
MSEPNVPLQLKSQKFRDAREKDWRALARAVDRAESGKINQFTTDELLNLPVLYRSTVSSLSMAQSISLDKNLITYLQSLTARAYVFIYGPQARARELFAGFFGRTWPQAYRGIGPELFLSCLCFFLGALGGWLMCAHDPSWYNALVGDMAQGRNLQASPEDLKATLAGAEKGDALAVFSVYLMSNNTRVTLLAFAVGIIGGLPTAFILLMNGMLLGAMVWLFFEKGVGVEFLAWLSIHGTTEILAIIIGGAAGFHLARKLIFPGHLTRQASLAEGGRRAGTVMLGAMLMLVIAGLLEGIGRQTITETWARFAVGGIMLAFWMLYFNFSSRPKPLNLGQKS